MRSQTVARPYIKITFQKGDRKKHGQNGVRMEDIVDILIGRLRSAQNTLYKNEDNERALLYLEEAKSALRARGRVYDD